ncbi:MAG: type II toxin-antitoxin system VapC family toxin [Terriglobales bacterium]
MSAVFADSSAFLAHQVSEDRFHGRAVASLAQLDRERAKLVTTSYTLVETYALLGRRAGSEAARIFRRDVEPLLHVVWVDEGLHQAGLDTWLDGSRRLSLVDAVSFVVMRRERIDQAWSYDSDFESSGFTLLP